MHYHSPLKLGVCSSRSLLWYTANRPQIPHGWLPQPPLVGLSCYYISTTYHLPVTPFHRIPSQWTTSSHHHRIPQHHYKSSRRRYFYGALMEEFVPPQSQQHQRLFATTTTTKQTEKWDDPIKKGKKKKKTNTKKKIEITSEASSFLSSSSSTAPLRVKKGKTTLSKLATLDISNYRGWDTVDDHGDDSSKDQGIFVNGITCTEQDTETATSTLSTTTSMSANKATGVGTELPIYNTLVTQTPLSEKAVMKPYDGRSIKNADYAVKLEKKRVKRIAQNHVFDKKCRTCPSCRSQFGGHHRMISHLMDCKKCFFKCEPQLQKELHEFVQTRLESRSVQRENRQLKLLTNHGTQYQHLIKRYQNGNPDMSVWNINIVRKHYQLKRLYPIRGTEDTDSDDDSDDEDDDESNKDDDKLVDTDNDVSAQNDLDTKQKLDNTDNDAPDQTDSVTTQR